MFRLFNRSHSAIKLIEVQLGGKSIRVPVATLNGNSAGPTLLITAGNDGDEYAGIAAAYRLIEEFSNTSFSGTLRIIPVVNIPGFVQEMSQNPIDQKFPKYIYPGNPGGSASERLRYWISEFAETSNFWLDLHGGSLVESLIPFSWAWKSDHKAIDMKVSSMMQKFPLPYSVLSSSLEFSKRLAAKGCGYLLTESGAGGDNLGKSIELHLSLAHIVMTELFMIDGTYHIHQKKIFSGATDHILRTNGVWFTDVVPGMFVKKGALIGKVYSMSGNISETIKAKHDGIILWGKNGMSGRKGDVVAGVGY